MLNGLEQEEYQRILSKMTDKLHKLIDEVGQYFQDHVVMNDQYIENQDKALNERKRLTRKCHKFMTLIQDLYGCYS